MNLNTYMPVRIISGHGCLKENADVLRQFGDKCLIVTGGRSAKESGALKDATESLEKLGISYEIFDGITQNPYTEDCHRAGDAARKCGAQFIFGIGGGSPLDASKAVAIYAANPELSAADIYLRQYQNAPLPVVLVGTTAGTGSEVTGVAVLTNSENGMKKSISGADCYAAVSFCDAAYTSSMPYGVTVSTALDAISHAAESYFSSVSNEISELYAEKAFALLKDGLFGFTRNRNLPDENGRETLYRASLFAGLALNITGTCFPHTMGYILTEDFAIPHGRACAAFLPDFLMIAENFCPEKAKKLYELMGTNRDELLSMLGTLAAVDVSMTREKAEEYGKRWTSPVKNFSRTPGHFTAETAVSILLKFVKD